MRCLVTGAAGFIGSHLAERLIRDGHEVVGVDCFLDYYPRALKERNVVDLRSASRFRFEAVDLARDELAPLLDGVERVFHQAAQAGVRASWGEQFHVYTENNVYATQRLLEACRDARVGRVVYASSSSVYGDTPIRPMREDVLPSPVSPYGVSKLAAEHLCRLYWKNFGLETVSLRYFTVFGPRQRPDMAFHRFLRAAHLDEEIVLYDDGEQTRDFTFIADAIDANVAAADGGRPGEVYNVGGGAEVSVNHVLELVSGLSGQTLRVRREARQRGDVRHTSADCGLAKSEFGYEPKVALEDGLGAEWDWVRTVYP